MKILNSLSARYKSAIREKAIKQAKTRIVLAGKQPQDFSADDLEVIVSEEEEGIKLAIKEKGVLAVLAVFGLGFLG